MTAVTDLPTAQGFLTLLRAGIEGLLSTDLTALAGPEVTEILVEFETQLRRAQGVDHRLIAEIGERSIAGELGAASVPALLVRLLRVMPGEAKARVRAAEELGPRRAVTGEALQPVLPQTADAVRVGEISRAHVAVISKALDAVPTTVPGEVHDIAEAFLVEAARHEHPAALARTAQQLLLRLDPDGHEPREDEQQRRRDFTLMKNPDGTGTARPRFTPEAVALLETLFDSLAAPTPAADGMPDTRTPGQRRHDALIDAIYRLLNSATLPATGGTPVTLLLRMHAPDPSTPDMTPDPPSDPASYLPSDQLSDDATVQTGHGDVWSLRQLLKLTGELAIVPLLMGADGELLNCGRTRRLATKAQRLALFDRDGGCCFPGCDRPAAWTEVHHIIEWILGGPTDIDNLCLLCRYHHRHFQQFGWTVRMATDHQPEWLPPPWIDPHRRPVRNTAHHLRDFDFVGG